MLVGLAQSAAAEAQGRKPTGLYCFLAADSAGIVRLVQFDSDQPARGPWPVDIGSTRPAVVAEEVLPVLPETGALGGPKHDPRP